MEDATQVQADEHVQRLTDTQRLSDEIERLQLRARMLLAEHHHVLTSMNELQEQLAAASSSKSPPSPS